MIVLPPKITQITDLEYKDLLLKQRNYDLFYRKYFTFFCKATAKYRSFFSKEEYYDHLYVAVMLKIPLWGGKSSLGTFLYSAIRYYFMDELRVLINRETNYQESPIDNFLFLPFKENEDFYKKLESLELDEEEKLALEFFSRHPVHTKVPLKFNRQAFRTFLTTKKLKNDSYDLEHLKKRLGYRIITEFLPDRKDLLLKFDLVTLRP